jgi:NADPH-dependent ferric siderophore reductase
MTKAQSGSDGGRAALMNNSVALAERLGVGRYDLRVAEVIDFGRSMRRIVLSAPASVDPAPRPGQDLMLSFVAPDAHVIRRRYTIRHHDPVASTVTIDMVLHGDGPGARWAARVQPGAEIEAIGPRGVVTIDADAAWHLFIGDESFLPAMSSMTESLPAGVPVILICEADEPGELPPILANPSPAPRFLRRHASASAGDARQLLASLAATTFPEGTGRAYVGGEFHVVSALKQALFARGLDEAQVSAKAYWRAGSANANHGEPER